MSEYITVAVVVAGLSLAGPAGSSPTASDLLQRYAENQDRLTGSFCLKYEFSRERDGRFSGPDMRDFSGRRTRYECGEVRYDGARTKNIQEVWGDFNSYLRGLSRADAVYRSWSWDGQQYIAYGSRLPGARSAFPGQAVIRREASAKPGTFVLRSSCEQFFGHFRSNKERIDTVLRQASRLLVRPRQEDVHGMACYVIDAADRHHTYTLWIDPQRGCNIAQAEVRQTTHQLDGKPVPGRMERLSNVRLEQIDGVWVPMEGDLAIDEHWPNGDWRTFREHYRRTEVLVDPDHERLGSFLPTDIKNGAKVYLMPNTTVSYRWEDGELIPNVDESVVGELDEICDEILAQGETPPALKREERPVSAGSSAWETLLDQYAATQAKLASHGTAGESTMQAGPSLRETKGKEMERCVFHTDGTNMSHRATFWDGVLSTEKQLGYRSLLFEGRMLVRFRRGLEPQNDRVYAHVLASAAHANEAVADDYRGAALMGWCPGQRERIDHVLRRLDDTSLRPAPEEIAGVACHVIEGHRGESTCRVWIDPQHGHNLARIEIVGAPGVKDSFLLDDIRFQLVQDVWVPIEARMKHTKSGEVTAWHHRRSGFTLNPDHQALGSFLPGDIPPGTKGLMIAERPVKCVWRDGRPTEDTNDVPD